MLSKDSFNEGIQLLITEYGDRGFKMTKERAALWYKYMKDMSNAEFQKKIQNCLMNCKRVPFIADVLDLKGNESFEPANAGAYEYV